MTRAVSALTFCLTLLAASDVGAGSSASRVDARSIRPQIQRADSEDGIPLLKGMAQQKLCDVLIRVPLLPLPALCHSQQLKQHKSTPPVTN